VLPGGDSNNQQQPQEAFFGWLSGITGWRHPFPVGEESYLPPDCWLFLPLINSIVPPDFWNLEKIILDIIERIFYNHFTLEQIF